jgi:hypothetical protein
MWLVFSILTKDMVACPFMIDFFEFEIAEQYPTEDIDSELESLEHLVEMSLLALSVSHEI